MCSDDEVELTDVKYLRDLAQRLFRVPVMYGVDQGDCSRLEDIATNLEKGNG